MCDPLEAQSHIDDFFGLVDREDENEYRNLNYRIKLLESPAKGSIEPILRWRNGGTRISSHCLPTIEVRELLKRQPSPIKIIFTGIDEPNPTNLHGLRDIFESFSFPTAFLKERVQGVTNSFGRRDTELTQDSWLHFLCKNIVVRDNEANIFDALHNTFDIHHPTAGQVDPSWIQGGFFMKWNRIGGFITLICFGSFPKLEERLQRFIENADNVRTALYDPYALYSIILDELHRKMDSIVWELISIYNRTESQIFEFANAQQKHKGRGHDVDFVKLHHLMKLVIHLKEACEAIMETAKSMQTAHNDLFDKKYFKDKKPDPAIPATTKDLEYLLSSFHGLGLRIRSVETRANNVINLAFNLVIQRDSVQLQKDSQSMMTVAIMTLVFLPGTAVASVFGSQFFSADFSDSEVGHLKVSSDFWVFWVLVGVVTGITLLAWWSWLRASTKRRFAVDSEHRGRGISSMA